MEGGRPINYEIGFILILLKAVINQKPSQPLRKQVNWDTVLKVSDFQNIISLVYHGMLGLEKEASEECQYTFYQKYKKELLLRESYISVEEVIMWQLEKHRIHGLFLSGTGSGELYPKPEMAHIGRLEIFVEESALPIIHDFMREMDYEQKEDRLGDGIIYTRTPGIRIVFYGKVPVENKVLQKYFSDPVKKYLPLEKRKYIHILSEEEEYLYRVGRLVEMYIVGMLKIQDILDFWQFHKVIGDQFRWKDVNELLEKARLKEFVRAVGLLSILWFGDGGRLDYGTALELEEYILSGGKENRHLDEAILPHERVRLDFYRRDREEEWSNKKREWFFPPREYMMQFFPVLEKHPSLLLFCWLARCIRLLKRILMGWLRKTAAKIRNKGSTLKERIRALRHKKKEEEPVGIPSEGPGVTPKEIQDGTNMEEEKGI